MQGRGKAITPLKAAALALLGLVGVADAVTGFLAAWRHVRLSPELVDRWPGGAIGFGLSCAVAALAGWAGTGTFLGGVGTSADTGTGTSTSTGTSTGLAAGGGSHGSPVRCLVTRTVRRRAAGAAVCAALGLTGFLYGLAVVPPRWCYQSTSPRCSSLPGAAAAGLTFLGTLIVAFFAQGTVAPMLERRCREFGAAVRTGVRRARGRRRDGGAATG